MHKGIIILAVLALVALLLFGTVVLAPVKLDVKKLWGRGKPVTRVLVVSV